MIFPNTYPSRKEFTRFNLFVRLEITIFLLSQGVLQQYLCDSIVRIENDIVEFARKINKDRNELFKLSKIYGNYLDNVYDEGYEDDNEDDMVDPNKDDYTAIKLLKSLTGGAKWYKFKEQNALAVQRKYGKPHLFITFTCNPKWPEIVNSMTKNVNSIHRPDIVNRVFRYKMQELIYMLNNGLFGDKVYLFFSVEFQKRGLPHIHVLIRLNHFEKTAESINKVISAEIPDKNHDPELHDLVVRHMLHHDCPTLKEKGPCWSASKNKCIKDFPKAFVPETYIDSKTGKVCYRRTDNTAEKITLKNNRVVNNSFVVPYNEFLLKYFDAHINIEIVNQVLAVNYLFKYLVKDGETNKVNVELLLNDEKKDEISEYQKVRCIGSSDSAWKIMEYPICANTVTVEVLYIHEKPAQNGKYTIPFLREEGNFLNAPELNTDADAFQHLVTTHTVGKSKLMAYFDLMDEEHCSSNPDFEILDLTYENVPTKFKWDPLHPKDSDIPRNKRGAWIKRKQKRKAIGRIIAISKKNVELFAMRILLIHKKGVRSFDDLKTINGIQFPTYEAAARHLNLIQNGVLEAEYFNELRDMLTPPEFINAFAIYICHEPNFKDHLKVFDEHKNYMNQLFLPRYRRNTNGPVPEIIAVKKANNHLLYEINVILSINGYDIRKSNLPFNAIVYEDIIDHEGENVEDDVRALEQYISTATSGQKESFETFKLLLRSARKCRAMMIEGPAGTGKTFVYQMFATYLRTEGKLYINIATTGIAASLFKNGQTAHSLFKIPLNINDPDFEVKRENIRRLPDCERHRLKRSEVIFIDEVSMLSLKQLTYID
uniref:ATP-dependent DNA helicase n=1 Tax=Strongyloides papillosus TaxID=174720 RepID=A0A0N5BF22_STREA